MVWCGLFSPTLVRRILWEENPSPHEAPEIFERSEFVGRLYGARFPLLRNLSLEVSNIRDHLCGRPHKKGYAILLGRS